MSNFNSFSVDTEYGEIEVVNMQLDEAPNRIASAGFQAGPFFGTIYVTKSGDTVMDPFPYKNGRVAIIVGNAFRWRAGEMLAQRFHEISERISADFMKSA